MKTLENRISKLLLHQKKLESTITSLFKLLEEKDKIIKKYES